MRENKAIPTRETAFDDNREVIASAIHSAIVDNLSPEALGGVEAPTLETIRGAFESITTARLTKAQTPQDPANHWQFLRSPRKRDDISRVMLQRMNWHHGFGSANLWGSMFAQFDVGPETFKSLDTIAAVYVALFTKNGLNRSNSERWARALGRAS